MKDDAPNLQQNCTALIGLCNALAVFADECRAAATDCDAPAVEAAMAQIRVTGRKLSDLAGAFIFTPFAEDCDVVATGLVLKLIVTPRAED